MNKYFTFIFLFCFSFFAVVAQTNRELVTVEGQQYLLHKVAAGETIFTICKKYQIEQKELVQANPQLIFGLKQGDELKIKWIEEHDNHSPTKAEMNHDKNEDFVFHVVKKKETIYSISREYNIPIKSIYAYNPEAEIEVLENEIIRIPKTAVKSDTDGLIREDNEFYYHKVQPKENAYSLARKYKSTVGGIIKNNNELGKTFEIGMIVRIPKFTEELKQDLSYEESGEYFLHLVESGETFYTYKRRFGVEQNDLLLINPVLNDGLKAGLTIKIPSSKIKKVEVVAMNEDKFDKHIVEKGQTLYQLSKLYNVSILDIKNWNPELKVRGLIAGESIVIGNRIELDSIGINDGTAEVLDTLKANEEYIEPVLPDLIFNVQESEYKLECQREFLTVDDDTFRISMFLPLFYDKNDTANLVFRDEKEVAYLDSMKFVDPSIFEEYFDVRYDSITMQPDTILVDSMKVKEFRSLLAFPNNPNHVRNMLSFYEGVLLAVDSMQKAGINVSLDLYDSQNDKYLVDSLLYNNDFLNSNLIVGPVYAHLQNTVSNFSAKNRIPIISWLQSSDSLLHNNPYYFQVMPSKDYVLRKTADFIGDQYYDKNFVIMTLGSYTKLKEGDLVSLVREKFFSSGVYKELDEIRFTEVDFAKDGTRGYWQVKKTLKHNVENVIFIPTTDNRRQREAMLSRAINALNVLSDEFNITLIGVSDYPLFHSINTEYFHHLNLHYLAPTRIDYSNVNVNNFIASYRSSFSSEPNRYSFLGYDITYFFLDAYRTIGKNFVECISGFSSDLLQSDFNFQKVDEFSGYMNHSVFIMNFTTSFDVKEVSSLTEGRELIK